MSAKITVRDNVTYLDHTPEELPPLQGNTIQNQTSAPSIDHLKRVFSGKPPSKLDGVQPEDVEDYYGQFYCPICHIWHTSGNSRAVRHCGHVVCVMCWDGWADTSGTGPAHNRLTSCPICRIQVSQSETREVDFRATRFNCDSKVVKRLAETIETLKKENKDLRKAFDELQDAVGVLERQLESFARMEEELVDLEAGIEGMAIDD
ncbi:unnamed protein product [Rhizoctonia solani]|uniref:RING-type domain-containing protein n=1 Tax=Rhizoctonia solani TaxID=456999 RepID=A0A8H3DFW2_9AGAM|nr:unnamed protein product [Rhizoctonia solani]CAE7230834.1 unnamed protein product [Rhizoctonia solani]